MNKTVMVFLIFAFTLATFPYIHAETTNTNTAIKFYLDFQETTNKKKLDESILQLVPFVKASLSKRDIRISKTKEGAEFLLVFHEISCTYSGDSFGVVLKLTAVDPDITNEEGFYFIETGDCAGKKNPVETRKIAMDTAIYKLLGETVFKKYFLYIAQSNTNNSIENKN